MLAITHKLSLKKKGGGALDGKMESSLEVALHKFTINVYGSDSNNGKHVGEGQSGNLSSSIAAAYSSFWDCTVYTNSCVGL